MKFIRKSPMRTTISLVGNKKCESEKSEVESTGCTEDSLISSRTNSEIIEDEYASNRCHDKKKLRKLGIYLGLVSGVILIIWGISCFIYTPFRIMMTERLRMMPGFPPYEWWFHPPDRVLLRVYLFNVTNSEEFLSGAHSKLRVQEVGPLVYREKLIHKNPVFNENSTLSYIANRSAIFLPELNNIDLNSTIIMPNLPVLLMPSFLHDAPYFVKFGLNIMLRGHNANPFRTTTIQDYLWNMTDPILDTAQNLVPRWVPSKNTGILTNIYSDFEDQLNVFMGTKYGDRRFFQIDKFEGSQNLPGRGNQCKDKITNSTEGLAYPQFLTRNDTLRYWRKALCKVAVLDYSHDEYMYGVKGYKYKLIPELYNRTHPKGDDCYKGDPMLPDGVADVSPCYYGMPIAASYPHFLHASETVQSYVDGLEPDEEKHGSFVLTEPITGIPLIGKAKSQINLVMRPLSGFTNDKIKRFSNMVIPLAWLEYHQDGLPWYLQALIFITVRVVPLGQYFFAVFLIILGAFLVYRSNKKRKQVRQYLLENKLMNFEIEEFLKTKN